jgi:hypothetical protein
MNSSSTAKLTLVLGGFLGKDVAFKRLSALDGTASTYAKPFGRAFFSLHLGHEALSLYSLRTSVQVKNHIGFFFITCREFLSNGKLEN